MPRDNTVVVDITKHIEFKRSSQKVVRGTLDTILRDVASSEQEAMTDYYAIFGDVNMTDDFSEDSNRKMIDDKKRDYLKILQRKCKDSLYAISACFIIKDLAKKPAIFGEDFTMSISRYACAWLSESLNDRRIFNSFALKYSVTHLLSDFWSILGDYSTGA